eukprot:TRINITY_DN927_c5_g1_i1.p1 TRINITY_DN927_c5_g1~~TRINITY_DN927_c5_g1_i1.p1  ORF type:complete len:546 (+),score=52.11 TRINITY_DN927_c5_g1_i1:74-1711(+)
MPNEMISPKKRPSVEELIPAPAGKKPRMAAPHLDNPPKMARPDYLAMILTAPVTDITTSTPLQKATVMSEAAGCEVYIKREDMNPGFGHQIRAAYVMVSGLTHKQRANGSVIYSSGLGNFNECIGLACQRLNVAAKVYFVCPLTTPVKTLKELGEMKGNFEVVKIGSDANESAEHAAKSVKNEKRPAVYLNPFNSPEPIAGLGTVGVELFRQASKPDTIYVGVGTGSLLAALVEYSGAIHPGVEIVGVEAVDNTTMSSCIEKGYITPLNSPLNHFVEGTAVLTPNTHAFDILRNTATSFRMITVSNDEICAAIKAIFTDTRSILEPAGALAVAGLKKDVKKGKKCVAVLGSANMEFAMLRTVAERCEEKELLVTVDLPEEKGAFRKMYELVYPNQVTEFSYRFNGGTSPAKIFMSFQSGSKESGDKVVAALNSAGFKTLALCDNEMAKSHARYLVGGQGAPPDERLYRFIFPENSEALKTFLSALPSFINITLFHYRNHGADFGKVLVGFDVPPEEEMSFQNFISNVAYEFEDETTNPVYRLFLR